VRPLIEDGPYRYIRHPGYLGAVVALTGFGDRYVDYKARTKRIIPFIW